jgi:hypothetical protein
MCRGKAYRNLLLTKNLTGMNPVVWEVPIFLKDIFPGIHHQFEGPFALVNLCGNDLVFCESPVYNTEPPGTYFAVGMGVFLYYSLEPKSVG